MLFRSCCKMKDRHLYKHTAVIRLTLGGPTHFSVSHFFCLSFTAPPSSPIFPYDYSYYHNQSFISLPPFYFYASPYTPLYHLSFSPSCPIPLSLASLLPPFPLPPRPSCSRKVPSPRGAATRWSSFMSCDLSHSLPWVLRPHLRSLWDSGTPLPAPGSV